MRMGMHVLHTSYALERLADRVRAGGAGHAGNLEFDGFHDDAPVVSVVVPGLVDGFRAAPVV